MSEYIYCEKDVSDAIEDVNKETVNLGYRLLETLIERVLYNLKEYTNLHRFYGRNCSGCVGAPDDCDFAHGRGKAKSGWKKAVAGEIFDCPVRTSGTLQFDTNHPEKGIETIDISDRDKPPYPIIKKKIQKQGRSK